MDAPERLGWRRVVRRVGEVQRAVGRSGEIVRGEEPVGREVAHRAVAIDDLDPRRDRRVRRHAIGVEGGEVREAREVDAAVLGHDEPAVDRRCGRVGTPADDRDGRDLAAGGDPVQGAVGHAGEDQAPVAAPHGPFGEANPRYDGHGSRHETAPYPQPWCRRPARALLSLPVTSPAGRLLIVRHGQSTWNASGRWQGQADPPLSEHGVEQAELAAKALDEVDAVWSSDLERARHTAGILAARHGLEVRTDPRLRERAAGPWTGLTRGEIEARYPGYLADGRRPPGYEDDASLAARAFAALGDFAAALAGGTGVVVSHGGVILTVERWHGIERTPIHNLEARWLLVERGSPTGFAVGERVTLL